MLLNEFNKISDSETDSTMKDSTRKMLRFSNIENSKSAVIQNDLNNKQITNKLHVISPFKEEETFSQIPLEENHSTDNSVNLTCNFGNVFVSAANKNKN